MEDTPELPALIKTCSIAGENIPCKNGSGKRGKQEKEKENTNNTGNTTKASLGKLREAVG